MSQSSVETAETVAFPPLDLTVSDPERGIVPLYESESHTRTLNETPKEKAEHLVTFDIGDKRNPQHWA